jgi:hypothetical protein
LLHIGKSHAEKDSHDENENKIPEKKRLISRENFDVVFKIMKEHVNP